jgi:hypothetical protein
VAKAKTDEWLNDPMWIEWDAYSQLLRWDFTSYVQGDTLELALTKTLQLWRTRWEEVTGRTVHW